MKMFLMGAAGLAALAIGVAQASAESVTLQIGRAHV